MTNEPTERIVKVVRFFQFFGVLFVCIQLEAIPARADDQIDRLASSGDVAVEDSMTRTSSRAHAVLDLIVASVTGVRSGVCHVVVRYSEVDEGQEDLDKSDRGAEYLIGFDDDRGFYRYDERDSAMSGRPSQVIVTPDFVIGAPPDSSVMTKRGPSSMRRVIEYAPSDAPDVYRGSRDPLVMPFLSGAEFGDEISQRGLRSLIFEGVLRRRVKSFVDSEDGLTELVIQSEGEWVAEHRFTLDPVFGFLPVRCEVRTNGTRNKEWTKPDVTTTTWKKINGAFVPESVICSAHKAGKLANWKYDMSWEHVNSDLPESVFSRDSLDFHPGDRIEKVKDGRRILERIVPIESLAANASSTLPVVTTSRSLRVPIIIFVNVASLGVVYYLLNRKMTS